MKNEKNGLERYQFLTKLGEGGMGEVYLAEDLNLKRRVAVKKTVESNNVEILNAAEKEACTLANLKHPNLPTVYDYFIENNVQYIVMEFITGFNLSALMIHQPHYFTNEANAGILHTLLNLLAFLHGQNPTIIHRDLKPKNIIISEQGALYLVDFGLVKNAGINPENGTILTQSSKLFGYSPNYSSLEQRKGEPTFAPADIYSLCATLYFLYSGQSPVDSLDRADTRSKGQADPLPAIRFMNPTMPQNIGDLVMAGLELHRENRPATVAELRQILDESETRAAAYRPNFQTGEQNFPSSRSNHFRINFEEQLKQAKPDASVVLPVISPPVKKSRLIYGLPIILTFVLIGFFGYENWCYAQNKAIVERLERLPINDFDAIKREWENYGESQARTSYFRWGIKDVQDKIQQKVLSYADGVIGDYRQGGKTVKKDESFWQKPQTLLEKLAEASPENNDIKAKISYLKGQKDFAFAFEKGASKQSLLVSAQQNYQDSVKFNQKFGDPYFMLALTYIYGKNRDYSMALDNIELATKNGFPFDTRTKAVKGDCLQALADATVKNEGKKIKALDEITNEDEARGFLAKVQDSLKTVRDKYVAAKDLYEEARNYGTVDKSLQAINSRLQKLDEGISATDKLNLLLDVVNLQPNQEQ